jgi:hypothetical protein
MREGNILVVDLAEYVVDVKGPDRGSVLFH